MDSYMVTLVAEDGIMCWGLLFVLQTIIFYATADGKMSKENDEYLINTPGCQIHDFQMLYNDNLLTRNICGDRLIVFRKLDENRIKFIMKEPLKLCCYSYIYRSDVTPYQDKRVRYSDCQAFKNNTKIQITNDYLRLLCLDPIYHDYIAVVKELKEIPEKASEDPTWNVIMLGIDTMSRKRAYNSLPYTTSYLNENNWLDYRGYNKVAKNTIPNLLSVLTGRSELPWNDTACVPDMSACNDKVIWDSYAKAGYVTAFGEDGVYMSGTFQANHGFSVPPVHHYLRTLFVAGEIKLGKQVCSRLTTSAKQTTDYILDYVNTYKNKKYFGFFWLCTVSHDFGHSPKNVDQLLFEFFETLGLTDAMRNTFVFFFSDHGLTFGPGRYTIESHYEERLPMLFIWVPTKFRTQHLNEYKNLLNNQRRLTSPYDLHVTLWDILRYSDDSIEIPVRAECPNCTSLLRDNPGTRSCFDAGITEAWCTCHGQITVPALDNQVVVVLLQVAFFVERMHRAIPTKPCTACQRDYFKKVVRYHAYTFTNSNITHYVVAVLAKPHDKIYEATVSKFTREDGNEYSRITTFSRISRYIGLDFCSALREFRYTCECERRACGRRRGRGRQHRHRRRKKQRHRAKR